LLDKLLRLYNVSVSIVISVCPSSQRNLGITGKIFMRFGKTFSEEYKANKNLQ
jgi:hypothetical protein